ncbi:MAG: Ni/Fe-hydrogenase cytochrome b subunit [Gemmatimonadetes bacterium]|nr:Ni/Fe-hydrogenase cytochrome b subunit [Gemmatimonadota bacterium]
MDISRRTAITALATAAAATLPRPVRARAHKQPDPKALGVLYDPTRCIGCQECVRACATANDCDVAIATAPNPELTTRSLTVLRKYEPESGPATFRKVQCMHCVDPACVSACMLGAMSKTAAGPVEWNGDLCVGCRYCEIACPFNVPRFEWGTPLPKLTKCQLCPERRAQGLAPACADRCKMGALIFGPRADLLAEARRRITERPEKYNPKVYGEHDAGGTSVLYLAKAGVSFAEMGLPELGEASIPQLPETIQHTLYKGFAAPLALLGVFGTVVRRNSRLLHQVEREEADHEHHHSEPVGGRLLTWPFAILATLALVGLGTIVYRFLFGLGAATNLNDGYPMGLWIAFDVVTGTALACGGYAVAILVYLLNRGKYHPLVRAAIVTSALGYTLGGLSVLIDIGRAWNFYKIPLFFTEWNVNSILLEVALCIMLYTMVLWVELSPALFEGWQESRYPALRRLAVAALPRVEKAMPYVIAVGLLLPTMHQSSLGSLMLLAGAKLHPLWHTPLLPLLFLVSCVGMGYAAVVLEATISSKVFHRPSEVPMLRALAGPISVVLLTYVVLRLIDVVTRGMLPAVLALDSHSLLFLLEMTLFAAPAIALLLARRRAGAVFLATIAVTVILAGSLYRFSTYLISFNPGPQWSYFPSLGEFAVTIGLVAAELMGYVVLVKKFPILRGATTELGTGGQARPAAGAGPRSRRELEVSTAAVARTGTVLAGLLLALLVGTVAPASAQTRIRVPDRRCLTAELCLEQPLRADEPHGAICATCHDFSVQRKPAEAAAMCASAGCHGTSTEQLTPFHRGLSPEVRGNCISCHPAHASRIQAAGQNCHFCHDAGGLRPDVDPASNAHPQWRVNRLVTFRHEQHGGLTCLACHDNDGTTHGLPPQLKIETCRSCHHTEKAGVGCLACHEQKAVARVKQQMTRTLDIRVGKLDRPQRVLTFDHGRHIRAEDCKACHNGEGSALSAAATNCAGCHEQHQQPTAVCSNCHLPPAAGAHDRNAHLGCGGQGCHENAPHNVLTMPRNRSFCLACHQDRPEHHPGSTCVDCHRMPQPRAAAASQR